MILKFKPSPTALILHNVSLLSLWLSFSSFVQHKILLKSVHSSVCWSWGSSKDARTHVPACAILTHKNYLVTPVLFDAEPPHSITSQGWHDSNLPLRLWIHNCGFLVSSASHILHCWGEPSIYLIALTLSSATFPPNDSSILFLFYVNLGQWTRHALGPLEYRRS